MIRHHCLEGIAEQNGRVDCAASHLFGIPRSALSYPSAFIRINGASAKKSSRVSVGDSISVEYDEEVLEGLEAESIPLNKVYEDSDILVIDKEQDMLVHPGAGNYNGTVANALLGLYGEEFSTGNDSLRPGIVHRLDKDTSGIMVIAKTKHAHESLSRQFAEHTNEKYYEAIVKGNFRERTGQIDTSIRRDPKDRKRYAAVPDGTAGGKEAHTRYEVIAQCEGYSFLRIRILTGRTHQIRVHMASIKHPVVGDPIYSGRDKRFPDATLMLNSAELTITHPETGERMTFRSETPVRFMEFMDAIGLVRDTMHGKR